MQQPAARPVPTHPTGPIGTVAAAVAVAVAVAVARSSGGLSRIGGSRIGGGAPPSATEARCIRTQAQPQRGVRGGSIEVTGGSIEVRGGGRVAAGV